ncbi:hypothetical protein [Cellulomonas sp. ICMP 17802]|uniref:hypothetical protein n=1 Tax=Cellulomonas sp. ICMP 17802 TaxID=3239199 RepID=UPI00351AB16F
MTASDDVRTSAFPWATVIGWTALLLAGLAAVGAGLAASYAVDGARDPQSWGDLAAAVVLLYSTVPALVALPVAVVQARRGWAPPWRTRTTLVLAALAPVGLVALVVVSAFS